MASICKHLLASNQQSQFEKLFSPQFENFSSFQVFNNFTIKVKKYFFWLFLLLLNESFVFFLDFLSLMVNRPEFISSLVMKLDFISQRYSKSILSSLR
jgi:hypothetical protein